MRNHFIPTKPVVKFLMISANEAGQRIDNFLVKKLKGVPKSHLYAVIRKGEVRVNKGRILANYKLNEGDSVRIPPIRYNEQTKPTAQALSKLNQFKEINSRIIYEDAKLMVINKPSGLAVHGGSGVQLGLIEALRAQRESHAYLELVHRLDRETSGCLLIAKKSSMLRQLHQMLREGQVEKTYLTFVEGHWQGALRVEAPLQKNQLQGGERIVTVNPEGKEATTDFKRLAHSEFGTLMEARPITGRTHQIRVHAQYRGHPVAGDEKYGSKSFNRLFKEKGLARLFLHASQLKFKMPGTDEYIILKADLDEDLKFFLNNIQINLN